MWPYRWFVRMESFFNGNMYDIPNLVNLLQILSVLYQVPSPFGYHTLCFSLRPFFAEIKLIQALNGVTPVQHLY